MAIALHESRYHMGLLIHFESGVRHMHLRGDQELKSEGRWSHYRWIGPALTRDQLKRVQALAWLVHEMYIDEDLPYGLDPTSATFDAGGRAIIKPGGLGFSCASFVHALFEAAGLPLVQVQTWAQAPAERWEADRQAQQQILEELRQRPDRRRGWEERAEAEVGRHPSLHPLEVSAASAHPHRPLDYTAATSAALALEARLSA